MEYFTLLHLQKEPFSTSPDPEMFFQSTLHQGCLQKLEMAIRLKRGLSVVIGDIGTGKSTLCRQLIQEISRANSQIIPHLLLDPEFTTSLEFLTTIAKTFGLDCPNERPSEWQLKEAIKNHLFEQVMQQQKIPVLILDEGQKLPGFGVEILREFLNFETNQHKLLQIVIFAQEEFRAILKQKANFTDRITTCQHLRPLGLRDTWAMIAFRLKKAHTEPGSPPRLFSNAAILAIYWLTQGYPRRIVMLCSKVMIDLLIHHQQEAGALQVLRVAREDGGIQPARRRRWVLATSAIVTIGVVVLLLSVSGKKTTPIIASPTPAQTPVTAKQALPRIGPARPAPPPQIQAAPSSVVTEAARTTPKKRLPANLGSMEADQGSSLSKMIARVYGRYTPKNMAMVLQANPQVIDPDHIAPKTIITFPLRPQDETATPHNQAWRLELTQTADLAVAYVIVKDYPATAPPLLIEPTVTAENGINFHIVLEETFADADTANARIKDLPPHWQHDAKAVNASEF